MFFLCRAQLPPMKKAKKLKVAVEEMETEVAEVEEEEGDGRRAINYQVS